MKKTMLFVISKGTVGGAQSWVKDQYKLFIDTRELYLWVGDNGSLARLFGKSNSAIYSLLKSPASFLLIFKLVYFIRRNNVDVVVANSAYAGVLCRLLRIFEPKVRIIYVSHGWSSLYSNSRLRKLFIRVERLLAHLTDKIICISNSDYERAKSSIGIRQDKLCLIRNMIYSEVADDERSRSPNELEKFDSQHTLKLLFVGRLEEPKIPELLLKAVSNRFEYEVTVIGTGPKFNELKQLAGKNTKLLGELADFDSFSDYDALVLSSRSEGLPMVGLEAASQGLPLVLSNVGGCPELIFSYGSKSNGILFDNEESSLLEALEKVHNNYSDFKAVADMSKSQFLMNKENNPYTEVYFPS